MNRRKLRIAYHAVVRYVERIVGTVSPKEARRQIDQLVNTPRTLSAMARMGYPDCRILTRNITFCVRSGCVTTCYPDRRR